MDVARRLSDLDPLSDTDDLHVTRLADGFCHKLDLVPFARGELGERAEASVHQLGIHDQRLEVLELSLQELRNQVQRIL